MEKYCLRPHRIPQYLYRVQYDNAVTQETDKWLIAGDTGTWWRTKTLDEFEEAVDCHLSNWHEPSIFISAFDHRGRASEWMARHWWRCDVGAKVFEIDTLALGHKYIYRAKSLARELEMNTEGLDHHDLYYEYLVLHRIPKSAFRRCWRVTLIDIEYPYGHRIVQDPRNLGDTKLIEYTRITEKKDHSGEKEPTEDKNLAENKVVAGNKHLQTIPEAP
jgi:hypothetical protein